MEKGMCYAISSKLAKVKSLRLELAGVLGAEMEKKEKVGRAKGLKTEMDRLIAEVLQFRPDVKYFANLHDESRWKHFEEEYLKILSNGGEKRDEILAKFEEIFTSDVVKIFKEEWYKDFISMHTGDEEVLQMVKNMEMRVLGKDSPDDDFTFWQYCIFLSVINSAFLRRTMDNNSTLVLGDEVQFKSNKVDALKAGNVKVIGRLGSHVAEGLDGARIRAQVVEFSAGVEMKKGFLRVDNAFDRFAAKMRGGVAMAEHTDHSMAYDATGGTVVCRETATFFGQEYTGKVTVLADKFGGYGEFGKNFCLFQYKRRKINGTGTKPDIYQNIYLRVFKGVPQIANEGWQPINGYNHKKLIKEGRGLVLLDMTTDEVSVTDGMKGGILVLPRLNNAIVGKGMIDGAVIIDDKNITPEEARKHISHENREGGVILMRIVDNDDPSKTKLIDLENPFEEEE